jgi:hypothetical protein
MTAINNKDKKNIPEDCREVMPGTVKHFQTLAWKETSVLYGFASMSGAIPEAKKPMEKLEQACFRAANQDPCVQTSYAEARRMVASARQTIIDWWGENKGSVSFEGISAAWSEDGMESHALCFGLFMGMQFFPEAMTEADETPHTPHTLVDKLEIFLKFLAENHVLTKMMGMALFPRESINYITSGDPAILPAHIDLTDAYTAEVRDIGHRSLHAVLEVRKTPACVSIPFFSGFHPCASCPRVCFRLHMIYIFSLTEYGEVHPCRC